MSYFGGQYVGDPFRFCRGDQGQHRPSDYHRFQHINVTHALWGLEWTLPECIQHVTERGRFEARREHESYILVREHGKKLWQKPGPYYVEDAAGNLIVQPDPQSSRYGLTPQGVLQLCVLSSPPFQVEEPLIADMRPAVTQKKSRACIDRPHLVEALADALLWYEHSIHALEDQSTVRRRLDWSPITQLLSDHFDIIADDIEATLNSYRGKAPLPEGFDHDWLTGVLQVYSPLKTLSRKDVRKWLDLAPAVAQLLRTLPAIAYAKLPWPNPPFARSTIDIELRDLQRQILFDGYDDESQKARQRALIFDQQVQSILGQWQDQGTLDKWLARGEEAIVQEMTRILCGNDSVSPTHEKQRVPRRERLKWPLHALRFVLYQGTWPRQSLEDTPLYETLLLRMNEAFTRYGSSTWPHTFIEHAMVKILQQVGLEDFAKPQLIVDRLRKRLRRFETTLQDALKAAIERRYS
jgi:hypothetical protein